MNYDFVIKNGMVVDPLNGLHKRADIGVRKGKIKDIREEINSCNNIIDVSNYTVIPGAIDMNDHCESTLNNAVGFYMIASTGITTVVDFADYEYDILDCMIKNKTYGLNVSTIRTLKHSILKADYSYVDGEEQIENAMLSGALGLKILGGHFPLSPKATEYTIKAANDRKALVAIHSGTTEHRSDIEGMRESVELSNGLPIILSHVNAYCRGKIRPYLLELNEAFDLLRKNKNIYSDSHLDIMNSCHGICINSIPQDQITVNCLDMFGYDITEKGLRKAINDGIVKVMRSKDLNTVLLEKTEAVEYWQNNFTNTMISFPANNADAATACALERRIPNGEFLISMTATHGGVIPRNNLIEKMLHLYQMGYLSLEDVVTKISSTPAQIFGFINKGHLGAGADADITVLDLEKSKPIMSFANGQMIMKEGRCVGEGGTMLVTNNAVKHVKTCGLKYDVIDLKNSLLYKNI